MTTLPNAVSSNYAGTAADFRNAKVDRSGANRTEYFTATIADSSSVGYRVGLVPFQKGARFIQGASQLHVTDITTTTTTTLNVGYLYYTSTASDTDAFASLLTTGVSGGLISFDEEEGLSWEAADDGWIVAEIAGSAVTTAGTIKGQIVLSYD